MPITITLKLFTFPDRGKDVCCWLAFAPCSVMEDYVVQFHLIILLEQSLEDRMEPARSRLSMSKSVFCTQCRLTRADIMTGCRLEESLNVLVVSQSVCYIL